MPASSQLNPRASSGPPRFWGLAEGAALALWLAGTGFADPPRPASAEPFPYSRDRYEVLWRMPWFFQPYQGEGAGNGRAEPSTPNFPFQLSGIAEWRGQILVYLTAEDGSVRERVVGESYPDVEVVSARVGGGMTGNKALVRYQSYYYNLEFDLEKRTIVTPDLARVPEIVQPANVRVSPRREPSKSVNKRAIQSRLRRHAEDMDTDDWFDGWFEEESPAADRSPFPGLDGWDLRARRTAKE